MVAVQTLEAFVDGFFAALEALALVPDLGLEEDVGPIRHAFPDALLVLIDRGGVDQEVAGIERGADRLGCVAIVDLVGAEAQLRNLAIIVEGKRGIVGHRFSFALTMVQRGEVSRNRLALSVASAYLPHRLFSTG